MTIRSAGCSSWYIVVLLAAWSSQMPPCPPSELGGSAHSCIHRRNKMVAVAGVVRSRHPRMVLYVASPQWRGAAATFVARERLVVGGLAWPTAHNHMSLGPSGMLPGTTMNSTPWLVNRCISYLRLSLDRRSVTFCRRCIAPIGSYFGIGRAALERCVTLCLLPPVRAERQLRRRNDCAAYHHSLLAWVRAL